MTSSVFPQVAEIARVAQRRRRFQQLLNLIGSIHSEFNKIHSLVNEEGMFFGECC